MSRYGYNIKQLSDEHFQKKLSDYGFIRGDLVTYASGKEETGGVIFRINEDSPPIRPAETMKKIKRVRSVWHSQSNTFLNQETEVIDYGYWDEKGRKLLQAAIKGFVRIKPVFDFFATPKGKKPKGKGDTLIITYDLKKVDIVVLGAKYVELGNVLRDVAIKGGMSDENIVT